MGERDRFVSALRLIPTQMICFELEADWLECWTRDRKAVSSNAGRSDGRTFFSRVNFVC